MAYDDSRFRTNRRTVLIGCLGGTLSLAGCTCQGDTRSGLEFDTRLKSIRHRDRADVWEAACTVLVRFDFVSDDRSAVGFTDAALVAFAHDGNEIARHPFGDVTWKTVPRSNRNSFDAQCGDRYEMGHVTRQGHLETERFPYWFGLRWDKRTGPNPVEDGDEVIKYVGEAVPNTTPRTSGYEQRTVSRSEWPPKTTPTDRTDG